MAPPPTLPHRIADRLRRYTARSAVTDVPGEDAPVLPLIEIDIDPVIAHIGPFALRWYSLM
ncbi:MAG: hypothetical protein EBS89_01710, partial [Proteobacteria bacterium]|nr:hypothetical protein [Pseudomonadota bacterium]